MKISNIQRIPVEINSGKVKLHSSEFSAHSRFVYFAHYVIIVRAAENFTVLIVDD